MYCSSSRPRSPAVRPDTVSLHTPLIGPAEQLAQREEVEARLLPHAATWAGLREPMNMRLVLTGPGGCTWDIAVGEARSARPGPRNRGRCGRVCRPATGAFPAELDLHISADPGRAARMLAAVPALALG